MRERGRRMAGGWRRRSDTEQIHAYTRWSMYYTSPFMGVLMPLLAVRTLHGLGVADGWLWFLVVLGAAQAVPSMFITRRALDRVRTDAPQPAARGLWLLAGATAVLLIAGQGLVLHGVPSASADHSTTLGSAVGLLAITPASAWASLGMLGRSRRVALLSLAPGALGMGVLAAQGAGRALLLALPIAFVVVSAFMAALMHCGMWQLRVVWRLDRARDVEARLAVAEERLRFGRDLHDVLGRNLSVLSLKAQLAVRLAEQQGDPEAHAKAVAQMREVQELADGSLREAREVARGYRRPDLEAELAGMRSVLTAAGVDCRVQGASGSLPRGVQDALAWVVREGTTNVIRHSRARRCTVRLAHAGARVRLELENDGVAAREDGADGCGDGSGLRGLADRLEAMGGTVDGGPAPGGLFRLVATVPTTAPEVPSAQARSAQAAASTAAAAEVRA
ncbi:hypothetical protein BIV57_04630 [Mangrovactinospora gilvigrisea]|uniref:Signal transduction histidine kinase subgroup 3 dimerisation and phosphoacceptor domain-containing protein n=2 Tax=Mangrovactinospora gilvigrisea TaxID=1428644 RepID=A0A1J7BYY0_9ACTN|nr:hypothetical protein BIV57_04630 [Mangrovactinospora gilvigrisea]